MHPILQQLSEDALDVMSSGAPVIALLHQFAESLQTELPDAIVGITVVDQPGRTFQHAVFPRLPIDFTSRLVNNPITDNRGSCGRAVLAGRVVESTDVENDERFSAEWKGLFRMYGLTSIVSTPALSMNGQAQGCIAVIHPRGVPPTAKERSFLQHAAALLAKISAYSRTHESQAMLIGEVEHRMRNLYATIGGMAIMTMRNHPEPRAFRQALDGRLMMMQRAHALGMSGREIEINALLHEVLAAYGSGSNLSFAGPSITLTSDAAAALAITIYELGTNAAKYGAFSQVGGEVKVVWSIAAQSPEEDGPSFSMTWQEIKGPAVKPPKRRGYGSLVINGSIRNAFEGLAVMSYDVEGLNCLITAPFTERLGRLVPESEIVGT